MTVIFHPHLIFGPDDELFASIGLDKRSGLIKIASEALCHRCLNEGGI